MSQLSKLASNSFQEFYSKQRGLAKEEPPSHKKVLLTGGGLGAAFGATLGAFSGPPPGSLKERLVHALIGAGVGGLTGAAIGELGRESTKSDIGTAKGIVGSKKPRTKALETYSGALEDRVHGLEARRFSDDLQRVLGAKDAFLAGFLFEMEKNSVSTATAYGAIAKRVTRYTPGMRLATKGEISTITSGAARAGEALSDAVTRPELRGIVRAAQEHYPKIRPKGLGLIERSVGYASDERVLGPALKAPGRLGEAGMKNVADIGNENLRAGIDIGQKIFRRHTAHKQV
jgi:hypothetical protein